MLHTTLDRTFPGDIHRFGCRHFGCVAVLDVSPFWRVAVLDVSPFWLSPFGSVAVLVCRRFGVSPFWSDAVLDLSPFWICRRFGCRRFGFVAVLTCIPYI